jgi:hypothetical protein
MTVQDGYPMCTAHAKEARALNRLEQRERLREAETKPARPLMPCGTEAAFKRHRRNQEPPCDACKYAHAKYAKQRRATR